MQQLKQVSENRHEIKDGKFSVVLEFQPDGKVILTVSVNFISINFSKQFDLTNIFKK